MSPLRRRDFRLVLVAIGVSALGDVIGLIPLALHVHDTTGSGLAVSALFIAMWGPIVVAAGLAGRLADRVESRALVLWVSLAQAVVVAGLAFATGSLAAVLVLTALLGLGTAIGAPAEFALVPVAAGEDQLAVANGHVETVRYAGLTAGPLVGGLLAAIGATRAALLIDAASFLVVAASVWALRVRRPGHGSERASGAADTTGVFAALAVDRELAVTVAGAVTSLAFMSISMTAEVFFAKDVLHAGDLGYGVLITAWTVGMVLGAMTLPRRVSPGRLAFGADRRRDPGSRDRARRRHRGHHRRGRRLPDRRCGARRQERPHANAHPPARTRAPTRPRIRRLQRTTRRNRNARPRGRRHARDTRRRATVTPPRGHRADRRRGTRAPRALPPSCS